ncbi:hypothetical protein AAC387_Pa02g2349 [Persea americana]
MKSRNVREETKKGNMKLELERDLCFSAALLLLLFGSGTLSTASAFQCNGSIAQCYNNQEEFFMETQISKGILASMQQKLDYSIFNPDIPAPTNAMQGRSYKNPRCNDPYLRDC